MLTLMGKAYMEWVRKSDEGEFPNTPGLMNIILDAQLKAGMLAPNDGKKRAIKRESAPCVMNALNCFVFEEE